MASVNWTARALNALASLHEYLSSEAPFYAEHIVRQLIDAVNRLEAYPLSGRLVPEAKRDDVREVLFRDYRIIYWVISPEHIDILGVLHAKRDLTQSKNQPWQIH